MARLLVSVRSASEARSAVAGGATIIDVKEPDRGPLGRACEMVWNSVRSAVPRQLPVSAALGELNEAEAWAETGACANLQYCKLGLAHAGSKWPARWRTVRARVGDGPEWVAVAYTDWRCAQAPRPEAVLDEALAAGCAGILFDTWAKSQPSELGEANLSLVERARSAGLLVALAGGLTEADIHRLRFLEPDYFAVRGAACAGGDRRGTIDRDRVARLVAAAQIETATAAGSRRFT